MVFFRSHKRAFVRVGEFGSHGYCLRLPGEMVRWLDLHVGTRMLIELHETNVLSGRPVPTLVICRAADTIDCTEDILRMLGGLQSVAPLTPQKEEDDFQAEVREQKLREAVGVLDDSGEGGDDA